VNALQKNRKKEFLRFLQSYLIQNISQTSQDFSLKGVGHVKASHIAHTQKKTVIKLTVYYLVVFQLKYVKLVVTSNTA